MSGDTFVEKITVLDEWDSGSESFRLVDKGAGPYELQVKKDVGWVAETRCYVHSLLTHRITSQAAAKPTHPAAEREAYMAKAIESWGPAKC